MFKFAKKDGGAVTDGTRPPRGLLTLCLCLLILPSCRGDWQLNFGGKQRSSHGIGGKPPHDITNTEGLRELYNSPVVHVEQMRRPLGNMKKMHGPLYHTGVRATLEDGRKYLVHKGPDYGISSETVVTDAKHMGNRWVPLGEGRDVKEATISDFIKAGGEKYRRFTDNCQHGARRMMDLSEDPPKK